MGDGGGIIAASYLSHTAHCRTENVAWQRLDAVFSIATRDQRAHLALVGDRDADCCLDRYGV